MKIAARLALFLMYFALQSADFSNAALASNNGGNSGSKTAQAVYEQAEADYVLERNEAAFTGFDRACTGGIMMACHKAGQMVLDGKSGAKGTARRERAKPYFQKSCDSEMLESCFKLAGSSFTLTKRERALAFAGLCKRNYGPACDKLARLLFYDREAEPEAKKAAITFFALACDLSVAKACQSLSTIYGIGRDVPKDDRKARNFRRLGCEAGSISACGMLKGMQLFGKGGPKDRDGYSRTNARIAKLCKALPAADPYKGKGFCSQY